MQSVPITTKVLSSNPVQTRITRYNWCDKVYHWLSAGRWFSLDTPVSSTNKTGRHNITEILLKVTSNTINPGIRLTYVCLVLRPKDSNNSYYPVSNINWYIKQLVFIVYEKWFFFLIWKMLKVIFFDSIESL